MKSETASALTDFTSPKNRVLVTPLISPTLDKKRCKARANIKSIKKTRIPNIGITRLKIRIPLGSNLENFKIV
jgi:hypothetical protein